MHTAAEWPGPHQSSLVAEAKGQVPPSCHTRKKEKDLPSLRLPPQKHNTLPVCIYKQMCVSFSFVSILFLPCMHFLFYLVLRPSSCSWVKNPSAFSSSVQPYSTWRGAVAGCCREYSCKFWYSA